MPASLRDIAEENPAKIDFLNGKLPMFNDQIPEESTGHTPRWENLGYV